MCGECNLLLPLDDCRDDAGSQVTRVASCTLDLISSLFCCCVSVMMSLPCWMMKYAAHVLSNFNADQG